MQFEPGDIAIARGHSDCRYGGHPPGVIAKAATDRITKGSEYLVLNVMPVWEWIKQIDPTAIDMMILAGVSGGPFCCGCFDKKPKPELEDERDEFTITSFTLEPVGD